MSDSVKTNPIYNWTHPTGGEPKRVAFIGLGPSYRDYIAQLLSNNPSMGYDEVWTVNMGCRAFQHDLVFSLDDLSLLDSVNPEHAKTIREHNRPVISSVGYPETGHVYEYPLGPISLLCDGAMYFNNTVSYMLAYALMIGVEHIDLYGCDYTHPEAGAHVGEAGRACTEFWMGFLRARGVNVCVTGSSTLTDANIGRPLYGYVIPPIFKTPEVETEEK